MAGEAGGANCEEWSGDEDITTLDTSTPSIEVQGPITISQAQQLQCQVNLFLCSSTNDVENRLLPNVGHQEGAGEPRKHAQQGGGPIQFGVQEFDFKSNSESRSPLH
jgi:hypothetical protein